MSSDFENVLTVVAVIFSSAFVIKIWRTKIVETAAELLATPILLLGYATKFLIYLGCGAAGVATVFGLGLGVFIYLGGELIMPDSVNFRSGPSVTATTNWAAVPNEVSQWRDHIASAATTCEVSEVLLVAIVQQESGGNPTVCSPVGACGLIQLMPDTAREMVVTNVFDPADNLRGGACYLKKQLDRYNNDEELALAAYNAGAGAVDRYGGVPPFVETKTYIRNINNLQNRYRGVTQTNLFATPLPFDLDGGCCIWPTDNGRITQFSNPKHVALDIGMETETPIYASHAGRVTVSGVHDGKYGGYGNYVMVDGGKYKTLYAHLSVRAVVTGEDVELGQLVGYSGNTGNSTGPHLHYEIYINGTLVDPLLYLPAKEEKRISDFN